MSLISSKCVLVQIKRMTYWATQVTSVVVIPYNVINRTDRILLPPPNGEGYVFISVGLCVCLSVCLLVTLRENT